MGTSGMKASLISREVIADSIELVARGHLFDGLVCLVACDKTNPGAAMAVGRLDIPSVVYYTGSIAPGLYRGRDVSIADVYEGIGAHAAGKITDADLHELEVGRVPGRGRVWGTVHRQHDVDDPRLHRPLNRWREWDRPCTPTRRRRPTRSAGSRCSWCGTTSGRARS